MIKFIPFKIEDYFVKLDLKKRKGLDKRKDVSSIKTDEFNLPLINAKFGDNGIMFYGREDDFDSAEMCIDIVQNGAIATGKVYAQPQKTGVLWDAYLVKPKFENLNIEILLYLTKCLEKSIQEKFSYDNKATWDRVKKEYVYLPSSDEKTPDTKYMESRIRELEESRIRELEESRIRELEEYLLASGLNDYQLTDEEKDFLKIKCETRDFLVSELFEPISGDFDIQQSHIGNKGEIVVSSGEMNSGIIGKTDVNAKIIPQNTITVDMFGNVYFRDFPYKMVTHARVFALIYKRKKLCVEEGLYLSRTLAYFKKIFSYDNMASWSKIKNLRIKLPVTIENNINYDYMRNYIIIMEKLAIKDVVDYKDMFINKTKEVICNS